MIPSIPLPTSFDPFIENVSNGYESLDEINPFSPKKPSLRRNFSSEVSSTQSSFMTVTPPKSSSSEYLPAVQSKLGISSPFSIPIPSPQNFRTPLKLVKPDPNVFSHSGYKSKRTRHTTTPSALRYRVRAKFSPISKCFHNDATDLFSSQTIEDRTSAIPSLTPRTPTKKSNTKFVLMSEIGPSTSPIRQYGYDSYNDVQAFPLSEHDVCSNLDFSDVPSSPRRLVFSKECIFQDDNSFSSSDIEQETYHNNSMSSVKLSENAINNSLYDRLNTLEWMSPKLNFLNANFFNSTTSTDLPFLNIALFEDYFLSRYSIIELIGSGSFAEVYKVYRIDNPSNISCIKKCKTPYSGNLDRYLKCI